MKNIATHNIQMAPLPERIYAEVKSLDESKKREFKDKLLQARETGVAIKKDEFKFVSADAIKEFNGIIKKEKGKLNEEQGLHFLQTSESHEEKVCTNTLDSIRKQYDDIQSKITTEETEEQALLINKRSEIEHSIDLLSKRRKLHANPFTDQFRCSVQLTPDILLHGVIDAVKATPTQIVIVEQKYRHGECLPTIPDHEKIQCYSYIYILSNIKHTLCVNTQTGAIQKRKPGEHWECLEHAQISCILLQIDAQSIESKIEIFWEPEFWERICNILIARAVATKALLTRPQELEQYLQVIENNEDIED